MTVQLRSDIQPAGLIDPAEFREQVDDEAEEFWGVPMDFFTVQKGKVLLDSRLASKLSWVVDERIGDSLTITAQAQSVTVGDQEIAVNPAFWCSNVTEEDIRD